MSGIADEGNGISKMLVLLILQNLYRSIPLLTPSRRMEKQMISQYGLTKNRIGEIGHDAAAYSVISKILQERCMPYIKKADKDGGSRQQKQNTMLKLAEILSQKNLISPDERAKLMILIRENIKS